ncbi:MAG: acyl carrier protein [Candidatus Sulfotelmatobacter sp.]
MTTLFELVRGIASDVFGLPANQITADSSPEDVEAWDSTQHLTFILALEEAFKVQLSPEEIDQARTVGDAARLVENKTLSQPR